MELSESRIEALYIQAKHAPGNQRLGQRSRIWLVTYALRELRSTAEFLKRVLFHDQCKFSPSSLGNKRNCREWVPKVELNSIKCWTTPVLLWFDVACPNEKYWDLLSWDRNCDRRDWQMAASVICLSEILRVPEEAIYQQNGALPHSTVLCVFTLTKSTSTVG